MKKLILFVLSVALLFSFCSSRKTGNFKLFLTDNPVPHIEHIYITISEISVKKSGEEAFKIVWQGSKTYDLRQIKDKEQLLADIKLEEGTYTQIKIVVISASIVIDDKTYDVGIPDVEVIIPIVFIVKEDGETAIVLDFDADQSLAPIIVGQIYLLKPAITVKIIRY